MKTHNSHSIKQNNTKIVLEKLVESRSTSRADLAKSTTLNKATISTIISDLIDKNIVIETDEFYHTGGRTAKVIKLNKNAGRIISVDLLTDSIYGIVANLYGEIVFELNLKVENQEFKSYLNDIFKAIEVLQENTYDSTYGLIGIGVGIYGILDVSKRIKFATFTSWEDIDLKSIIEEKTGIKTYVENEANISALGEMLAHLNYANVVSLNIGLGVGMGIIIDNKLYLGSDGYAGEIGHTIVVPNGKSCVCGNKGCLERYICDQAIESRYFELTNTHVSIDQFIENYLNKDATAQKIYFEFIDYLAIAVNNISQTLNPGAIVINSKIIENIEDSILDLRKKLKSKIMNLDLLTRTTFKHKTNVLGLTHLLIQEFLEIDNYKINFK